MAPGRGSQGFGAWQINHAESSPRPSRSLATSQPTLHSVPHGAGRPPGTGWVGGDSPFASCCSGAMPCRPVVASNTSAIRKLKSRWSAPGPGVSSRGSACNVPDGATYLPGRQTPVPASVPVSDKSGRSRSYSPTPKEQSYPVSARSQARPVVAPPPGKSPPPTTMDSLRGTGACSNCSPPRPPKMRPLDARSPLPLAPSPSSVSNRTRTPRVTIDLASPAQQPLGRSASGSLRASPARGGAPAATPIDHNRAGSPKPGIPGSPAGGGCRSRAPQSGVARPSSPPGARCRAGSPTGGATRRVSAEDATVARRKAIEAQLAAATGAVAEARQMLNRQPMRASTFEQLGDSMLEESLARMVSSIEASLDLASNCAGRIHKPGGVAVRCGPASGRCLPLPLRPKPLLIDGSSGDDKVAGHAGHTGMVRSARPGLKVGPPSPLGARRGGRHSPPGMGGMSTRLVQTSAGER